MQKNKKFIHISLLKVALYTITYAYLFYFIPLPTPAFVGFILPLIYLYHDMTIVEHIQFQYVAGFFVGLFLGIVVAKITIFSLFIGFCIMSLLVMLSAYLACFATIFKLPLIITCAVVAMFFDLAISNHVTDIPILAIKFSLGIGLSTLIYAIIDNLIGESVHRYFPKITIKDLYSHINFNDENAIRYVIAVYLSLSCVYTIQWLLDGNAALFTIAAGSVIVVLHHEFNMTFHNIISRGLGAISGIILGIIHLTLIQLMPFSWFIIASLVIIIVYFSYLSLVHATISKALPQIILIDLMMVVGTKNIFDYKSSLARVIGILIGIIIACIVAIFFCSKKSLLQPEASVNIK